ncbi:MAG: protein kinase [Candidatus Sulfotelmatobacter sp.]
MPLTPGTKLGPYEIQSALGAGGMGEVYRARDTRLDRTVAVKILPSHLSENPEAKQRFDREARTISSLNHPNICTLHDIGQQNGVDFLVMEYLEGETLADRLRKGPLPVEQVLRYGIEICDALEKAHRNGVVHRDLKPGNIMLTKSGAKLMDFGLAKTAAAVPATSSSLSVTMSTPIGSHPLTAQGAVVGTFQYMSPEQVEGKEADGRSDIFAMGAVLYEMATGKRAFEGKTAASAMAAVLERDPAPISSLQPGTPPALERLIKICLAKDPDERWQTAHDVKLQLRQIADGGSQTSAPALPLAPRENSFSWIWLTMVVLAVGAAAAIFMAYVESHKEPPTLRLAVNPPEKAQFNLSGDSGGPAVISPDGRSLVFSATSAGVSRLYLRSLDSITAQPLPGSEGGTFPFWSPDSRSIAFFTFDKLKRIDIDGTAPLAICDAALGRGGSWGPDDTILAALSYNTGISRVSANGGTPTLVTKVDNSVYTSHRWPWILPDGKHFLYNAVNHTIQTSPSTAVFYASIDGKENRPLFHTLSSAIYASGQLLSMRDNSLVAQSFDPASGKFSGEPEILSENAQYDGALWRANISASNNGLLVYASGSAAGSQSLAWYDRTGKNVGTIGELGAFQEVELSPDDKKLAATDANTAAAVIWIFDLASNLKTRLTFNGGVQRSPVWSPDARQIAFASDQQKQISVKGVNGGAPDQVVLTSPDADISFVSSWSRDGRYLLYERGFGLNLKLWVLPLSGDRKPFQYAESDAKEIEGVFSPDGRWVAYTSTEMNRPEIFVAPFPWTGARWQVSSGSGLEPRWRADGKELDYYDLSGIIAVQVDGSGSDFRVGGSQPLFHLALAGASREFDMTRDAQRFVGITPSEGASQGLTVVQNWLSELKKK